VVVVTQTEVLGRYLIAYTLVAVSVCAAEETDHGCEEAHVSHSHFLAHQMICYDAVAQIRSDPGTVLYCTVMYLGSRLVDGTEHKSGGPRYHYHGAGIARPWLLPVLFRRIT